MPFGLLDGHDIDVISHGPPGDMNHAIRPQGQENEGADGYLLIASSVAGWEITKGA